MSRDCLGVLSLHPPKKKPCSHFTRCVPVSGLPVVPSGVRCPLVPGSTVSVEKVSKDEERKLVKIDREFRSLVHRSYFDEGGHTLTTLSKFVHDTAVPKVQELLAAAAPADRASFKRRWEDQWVGVDGRVGTLMKM